MAADETLTLTYRVNAIEQDLKEMKREKLVTEIAVLKVKVAQMEATIQTQAAEIHLLDTRTVTSGGFFTGAKATVMLALAVLGGIGSSIVAVIALTGH